jgi:hypothetical protein
MWISGRVFSRTFLLEAANVSLASMIMNKEEPHGG